MVLFAGSVGAYFFGAFDRFFAPEPYRDPLLDSFEQRRVPSDPQSGESSFRVGEPGTVLPRTTATTTATTTDVVDDAGDEESGDPLPVEDPLTDQEVDEIE